MHHCRSLISPGPSVHMGEGGKGDEQGFGWPVNTKENEVIPGSVLRRQSTFLEVNQWSDSLGKGVGKSRMGKDH